MASRITALFKATVGFLGSRKRSRHKTDKTVDALKEQDITHSDKCCSFLDRKLDNIKGNVDKLAKKDLLASISFLKEGIIILHQVLSKTTRTSKDNLEGFQSEGVCSEIISLVKGLNNLGPSDLDDSAEEALSDAKRRFEDALKKATEAFSNEDLKTSDRILAMVVRVMGTILESVAMDNSANALAECSVCLKELHSLPAVQKCFGVKPMQDFRCWWKKDGRREVVANVYHLNCFIYDVMQLAGSTNKNDTFIWPYVDFGAEYVNSVCDPGVTPQINLDVTLLLINTKKVFDYIRFYFIPGKDTPEAVASELVVAGLISEQEFVVVALNLRKTIDNPPESKSIIFPLESSGRLTDFTDSCAGNGLAQLTINRPKARQS
ncbi:hypothetical protein ACROYT_G025056 [Oculina patagonica]